MYAWQQMARSGTGCWFDLDGVAIAGSGKSETTPVMGTFQVEVVGTPKERRCAHKHVRTKARFEGEQTSADSRLTGHLEIKATSVVKKNGYGYSKRTFGAPPDLQPRRVVPW
jgi:hypothetical protein